HPQSPATTWSSRQNARQKLRRITNPRTAQPRCLAAQADRSCDRRQRTEKERVMNKILIATDGSESSAEAVDFGVELAAQDDAAVLFVHVASVYDLIPAPGFGMTGAAPRVPHVLDDLDRAPLEDAEQAAQDHGVRA